MLAAHRTCNACGVEKSIEIAGNMIRLGQLLKLAGTASGGADAKALIATGQVTVNGATIRRAAARAALGDVVCVVVPEPKPRRAMSAEEVALEILYEDDHLLALNKPAGVVVHPAYKHPTGTLMNALLWRARAWPDGGRPSIVGRLDKDTTGIVLVAKAADGTRTQNLVLTKDALYH